MSLYPYSIAFIREKISDMFYGAKIFEAREAHLSQVKLHQVNIHAPSRIDIIEHILWMLE